MAPQFNMLKPRFDRVSGLYAWATYMASDRKTWLYLRVYGSLGLSEYNLSKVKGVYMAVPN